MSRYLPFRNDLEEGAQRRDTARGDGHESRDEVDVGRVVFIFDCWANVI